MSYIWVLLFYLFLRDVTAIECALYDYSQSKVACVQACPAGTTKVGSNCLSSFQYIVSGQVHLCEGYVSQDRSLCCPRQHYILEGACLSCRGQLYNNGLSCCANDQYLDYSTTTPSCQPLSTGPCASTLKLNSIFKICCPSNGFFLLPSKQCVSSTGYNCDSENKVCCLQGQKI